MDENKEMQTPEDTQAEPQVTADTLPIDEKGAAEAPAEEAVAEKANVEEAAAEREVSEAVEIAAEETPKAENGEMTAAPTDELVPVATSAPAPAQDAPQPPKKKTGLLVGIVVAAIVIGGAAFAMLGGGFGPKKIVKAAIANSYAQSEALAQQMEEEIPFMKKSAELREQNTHTDFNFTLNELSGTEEMAAVNFLFSGANAQGSMEMTPDAETISMNGALNIMGRQFISAVLYLSPDALAFGLPSINPEIAGIDLNNYQKDLENSPLKDAEMDVDSLVESIDEMKASIKSSAMSEEAAADITKKIQKMTDDLMDKAAYEQGETVDGVTSYIVTIAPKDVRNYVVSLLEYILLDSPLREVYETEYNISMVDDDYEGNGYEADMKQVLKDLQENMPDLAVEIVYAIKDEKEIVGYEMNVTTPNAKEDDPTKLEKFTVTGEGDATSGSIRGEINLDANGEKTTVLFALDTAYIDKVYSVNGGVRFMFAEETVDIVFGSEIDGNATEDNLHFEMVASVDDMDILDIYCAGDVYVEGEQVVYNLKHLGMVLDDSEENMGADFSLLLKQYAIDKVAEMPFTNLLTMTEEELTAWMNTYNNGFNQLFGSSDALN